MKQGWKGLGTELGSLLLTRGEGMKTESFCWHCQRKLLPKKGGGYYFAIVEDPLGHRHRVHKDCLQWSVEDGNKAIEVNHGA